jgi:hypothetical protein
MPNSIRETTIAVELQRLDAESQERLDWLPIKTTKDV